MRLDQYLYTEGMCESRTKAQNLIKSQRVTVNGKLCEKTSFEVYDGDDVKIKKNEEYDFVSRGGNKLEHAFRTFSFSAEDKICVDIGASTGGFTECLLLHGAKKVYAIDSGKNQLRAKLLANPKVVSMESFNARMLTSDDLNSERADVVVMDVSFISQKLLYPAVKAISSSPCDIITLIKPQFEAGKAALNKNGIVKSDKVRIKVVEDIINFAKDMGFEYVNHCQSPITGGDGNVEFLLHLRIK